MTQITKETDQKRKKVKYYIKESFLTALLAHDFFFFFFVIGSPQAQWLCLSLLCFQICFPII